MRVIDEEVRAGLERLEGVAGAALYRTNNGGDSVYYRNTAFTGTLSGVDARYFDVNGIQVTKGRGITKEDHEERRKVALVDQKTAASLFAGEEPVGSILEIRWGTFSRGGCLWEKECGGTDHQDCKRLLYLQREYFRGRLYPHCLLGPGLSL